MRDYPEEDFDLTPKKRAVTDRVGSDLAAEIERLTREVNEWACDNCNTVYPGPPQRGFMCVICPKCGGNTAPWASVKVWRVERERDAALAENERLREALTDIATYEPPMWNSPNDYLLGYAQCSDRALLALAPEGDRIATKIASLYQA